MNAHVARAHKTTNTLHTFSLLDEEQPDLIVFTNILIGGCIPEIKKKLNIPILVTLQGDDVFLDSLDEPYKSNCLQQINEIAKPNGTITLEEKF